MRGIVSLPCTLRALFQVPGPSYTIFAESLQCDTASPLRLRTLPVRRQKRALRTDSTLLGDKAAAAPPRRPCNLNLPPIYLRCPPAPPLHATQRHATTLPCPAVLNGYASPFIGRTAGGGGGGGRWSRRSVVRPYSVVLRRANSDADALIKAAPRAALIYGRPVGQRNNNLTAPGPERAVCAQ